MKLYTLEYSRYSDSRRMFLFHIAELNKILKRNLNDLEFGNTGDNVWMILHVGTQAECQTLMDNIIRERSIDGSNEKLADDSPYRAAR